MSGAHLSGRVRRRPHLRQRGTVGLFKKPLLNFGEPLGFSVDIRHGHPHVGRIRLVVCPGDAYQSLLLLLSFRKKFIFSGLPPMSVFSESVEVLVGEVEVDGCWPSDDYHIDK